MASPRQQSAMLMQIGVPPLSPNETDEEEGEQNAQNTDSCAEFEVKEFCTRHKHTPRIELAQDAMPWRTAKHVIGSRIDKQ